jgi:hypothetical protein
MEQRALSGTLTSPDVSCLEASSGEKANRLLMVHWWSADDKDAWRQRAQVEINRGLASNAPDPDILYKVALHDSKTGDHASAYDLSGHALEVVDALPETARETRRFNLLKIRAQAATKQWADSEVASEQAKMREAIAAFEAAQE